MSKRPSFPKHRTSKRRRALGQHFLADRAVARRMIDAFAPRPGQHVIEIGPGHGVLTERLLEAGARVTAVEIDPRLAARLRETYGAHPEFTLMAEDVLACDLAALAGTGTARVLANLPYAITGEVLVRLFAAAGRFSDLMLMLQREVVNRIVSEPGGRVYGSLSVLAQYFTRPRVLMRLGPRAFSPPPAVSSAVVAMPFRNDRELSADQERDYPVFVRALFAHRRQTLRNNVRAAGWSDAGGAAGLLERAGIDPARRPETLSRDECLALHRTLTARS